MSQAIGANTRVITSVEDAYNVVPTLSAVKSGIVTPFSSESLQKTQALTDSKVILNSRDSRKPARGNYETGGDLSTELNAQMFALLKYAIGGSTTVDSLSATIAPNNASVGTPPYTHTFKIGSIPSFVLEKKFTDLTTPKFHQYTGCKISRLSMDVKTDGLVDMRAGIMGADMIVAANSMAKSGADQNGFDLAYIHKPFESFELLAADLKIGGSAVAYISSLNINLENNTDGSVYIVGGTGSRKEMPAGIIKLSGKISCLFSDTAGADSSALITDAVAGTERSIDITFTRGSGAGTVGNEKLRIVLPEILLAVNTPPINGYGGLFVEFDYTAFYENSSEATTLMAVLTNSSAPRY